MRLPTAVLVLVALCLVALVATPIVMTRQLTAMRARSDRTTNVATTRLDSLRLLLSEEFLFHQLSRMEPGRMRDAPFHAYSQRRQAEQAVLSELRALAPRIDAEVTRDLAALERMLERWHEAPDARAAGRMTDAEFEAALATTGALLDSMLAAHARLTTAVARAEARNRARGGRAIARQNVVSVWLGGVAALALALLGWLAHRERAIARALSQAVHEEARQRAIAERRREDLVAVSESKNRLMRGFTHDVKNPIGAADGFLQLIEAGIMGPVTERQAAGLGRARRAIRSALALIGDLLDVARAESGRLTVERVPTDVRAVAYEVAEEFRAQAEAKGLALRTEAPDELPQVSSDPARVRQVIGNLLSNAVKYTPRGAVTVRVAELPSRRTSDRTACVVVEVADTGPGIPEEKQRLLFQEFTRLDPSAAPGVGIGLAMASRITDALGGDLSVRSEVGKGSTFALTLPVDAPAPAAARA